jgi:hypothetical protein
MELVSGNHQSEIEVMKSEKAQRPLSPAAQRALEEAEARRRAEKAKQPEPEVGGRDGPDPARYGDWEKGGIVSDF